MRITNLEKGEDYNLKPDTQIQIERTNPFFNDYGEQSTPLELPASDHNRRLLNFPDTLAQRRKAQLVDVTIQDGEYFAQCRQMVLSAQYKGNIATSFYINNGSFYSKIQNIKLKEVFKGEFIPGVNTVEQGIEFCRKLLDNTNDKFTIFPILVTDDSGGANAYNYKIINAFGREGAVQYEPRLVLTEGFKIKEEKGAPVYAFIPHVGGPFCDFYNAVERTEYVNNIPIRLKPGYYISPFIRANYLLQRIFKYFGYTLQDNFFSITEPFDNMAVLNNVIDVLVNGKIKVADLVPDVTCTDFLDVFRKKFCCEFSADEGSREVKVVFLREALQNVPSEDLTDCVTEEPTVIYKSEKDYQRIILQAADKLDAESTDSYDDLKSMYYANPGALFNPAEGTFYKVGFSGAYEVITKIGEAAQDYNTGEHLEPKEIKIPELIPEFRMLTVKTNVQGKKRTTELGKLLYVGNYIAVNSKMVVTGSDKEETSEKPVKQNTMLAFTYYDFSLTRGTISPYWVAYGDNHIKLFDYALYYNGPEGIYEKFYRPYDLMLRNSLHDMKVKLLLSLSQKQNLPAVAKVVIRGTPLFFNKLKFTLGGKNEPIESEFKTISLMEPITEAPKIQDILVNMVAEYKWVPKVTQEQVSREAYETSGIDKDRTFVTIYPPLPSKEFVGEKYGLQTSFTSKMLRDSSFWHHSEWEFTRTTVWLELVPNCD